MAGLRKARLRDGSRCDVADAVAAERVQPSPIDLASPQQLVGLLGNQTLARLLDQRKKTGGRLQRVDVALGPKREEGYADTEQLATEMRSDWDAIHRAGWIIDSAATVEKAKQRVRGVAPEQLEKLAPERWLYDELRGLRLALEQFGDLRKSVFQFRQGKMAVVDGDRGWTVGKTNAALGTNRVEGETWPETKETTIAMTGDCDVKNNELEAEAEGNVAEAPGARRERLVRSARAVWVHEIGHTMFLRFRPEWQASSTTWGNEPAPTKYARDRGVPEEDFADSFTMYVLYRDKLKSMAKHRHAFFAERHSALILKEPPEQKPTA